MCKGKSFLLLLDLEPEEPPRFAKKLPEETTVLEGDPFTIQLQVLGNPKPTVHWYVEDQPLKETEFLKITARGEWHKVSIDEILIDDEGIYKCVAENYLGVVETETEVLVEGKTTAFSNGIYELSLWYSIPLREVLKTSSSF